jgi:hypothetical protein
LIARIPQQQALSAKVQHLHFMNAIADIQTLNGNWKEVENFLADQLQTTRGNSLLQMDRVIEANAKSAEREYFGAAGIRGGTIVRAFWWGFHVEISHTDLPVVLGAADTVNTLVDLIGGSIPSPAQPWIKLIAPFVRVTIQLLQSLDRGRGIYISMSWFAPGNFVPTPVT